MTPSAPHRREQYPHFHAITTRWMDNDAYAHVNNVVYYSWFDTVVNEYLIRSGVLDVQGSQVIGLVVETHCNYFAPLAFPQTVVAALRVAHLGTSSVRYEIGFLPSIRTWQVLRATSFTCMSTASPDAPYRSAERCAQSWTRSASPECTAAPFSALCP